jgi:hypothetical protein
MSRKSQVLSLINGALTAAAQSLNDEASAPNAGQPGSATRVWQHAVLAYADSTPELSAGSMYVGNCLSRVRLKPAKRSPDGSINEAFEGAEPVDGVDPQIAGWAAEIVAGMRSKIGGQPELLRRYGEQMFLVGEVYLLLEDIPSGLITEVLTVLELVKQRGVNGSTYKRIWGDGSPDQVLPAGVEPNRVWRPDRRFGRLASSSAKACLVILDELDILTRLVKASSICAMALSGMLLIPDELDSPLDDAAPDDAEAMHPLIFDIIRQAVRAIDDPSSAAAFTPYILQGAADLLDKVRHIPFQASAGEHVTQRAEALQRLAQGLDLPVEVLLGHMSTTFSNAAQISVDTYKLHIEPMLQMLADAIQETILWPRLAQKMGLTPQQVKDGGYPPEIMAVGVHYDASDLVSHPDKSADVVTLATKDQTQTMVAIREVRMAVGLTPDDAPDDEEVARRLDAYRLAHIRETIAAPAADAAVSLEDAAKAVIPGQSAGSELIGTQAAAAQAAPAGETVTEANAAAPAVTAAASLPLWVYTVAGAADMTVERIAERTGGRIRSKLKPESLEAGLVSGRDNTDVASILGPEVVARVLGREDFIGAEVASFAQVVARQARHAGHPHPGVVAEGMAKLVAARARDRLYGSDAPVTVEMCQPLLV